MVPTLLLMSFTLAMLLMAVATFCFVMIFGIARNSLNKVFESDGALYQELVGTGEHSWIERGKDSITDTALWWKLYKGIYRNGSIGAAIGSTMQRRFVTYVHVMVTSYAIALSVAILVLAVGFTLA